MIAFCTTVKGRTQHLRETLPRNLDANPRSKFIVLDYNSEDGLLDYDELERIARECRPRLIVAGHSAYPRQLDFERLRAIADGVEAVRLYQEAET